MSTETRRKRQREELRTEILDAAREAFLRDGIESFSMRKLAASVGYSPGTIYLHFENKADILHALVEEGFVRLLEVIDRVHDDADPVRSLENKLRAYIEFGREMPHHYHFAFMVPRPPTGETARPHEAFDRLREAVCRCVEHGAFRSLDVETTSQALWTTIHGVTSLLIVHPEFPWVGKEAVIDDVLETAIRGLRARAALTADEE